MLIFTPTGKSVYVSGLWEEGHTCILHKERPQAWESNIGPKTSANLCHCTIHVAKQCVLKMCE